MELGDSITFSDDSFKYNELTIGLLNKGLLSNQFGEVIFMINEKKYPA